MGLAKNFTKVKTYTKHLILVMTLNVTMISCLLNDCTNRNYVFYDLFMSTFMLVFNRAPRKFFV